MIKENISFNYKEGDVEIRLTHTSNGLKYPEIVKWTDSSTCYTIAYWQSDRDGNWSLKFLDDRFFEVYPNGIPFGMWQGMQAVSKLINASMHEEELE